MYYAMMINADAKENLTVSPDGKVGSDPSALRISDLPVRNIETIRLSSCNTGLLNAINVSDARKMDSKVEPGVTYHTQGNVAQAFLENQNVHEVYAWDGNTNPRTLSGGDRLSHTQDGFHGALKYLGENNRQVVDIERSVWIDRRHFIDLWKRDMPMGEVRFFRTDTGLYCTYEYINDGNVVYGYVDLGTSYGEQFSSEEDRNEVIK